MLSDNTRNISFSNILGNLEEWGLVRIQNSNVSYPDWFWNSIQVEETNQDTSFYKFIYDNFIHAKISGQTLDYILEEMHSFTQNRSKKVLKQERFMKYLIICIH